MIIEAKESRSFVGSNSWEVLYIKQSPMVQLLEVLSILVDNPGKEKMNNHWSVNIAKR
jgi:hypothetical protein